MHTSTRQKIQCKYTNDLNFNTDARIRIAQVTMEAGKYLVEQFVVHGLVAAVALPMTVMSAANLIDTWWTVCLDRAEKAGKLLAHVLMSGAHGDR